MKVSKYSGKKEKINVCSCINENYGNIYNHYSENYFTSVEITQVLQAVRDFMGNNVKIVMFFDGAKIHTSHDTRNFAQRGDINIELCINIRY